MIEGHDYPDRALADPRLSVRPNRTALSWRPYRPPIDPALPAGVRAARILLWAVRIPAALVLVTDIVVVLAIQLGVLSLDLPRERSLDEPELMAAVVGAPDRSGEQYAARPTWGYDQIEPWAAVFAVGVMLAIVIAVDMVLSLLVARSRRIALFAMVLVALPVYGVALIAPNPLQFSVFRGSDAAELEIAPGQPAYLAVRAVLFGGLVACQLGALLAASLPSAWQTSSATPAKRPVGAFVGAIAAFALGLTALAWLVLNFAAVAGLRPRNSQYNRPYFDLYRADQQAYALVFALALAALAALAWWTAYTLWRGSRTPAATIVKCALTVAVPVSLLLAHLVEFPPDLHRRNAWAAEPAVWYSATSATVFQILLLCTLVIAICLAWRPTLRWASAPR